MRAHLLSDSYFTPVHRQHWSESKLWMRSNHSSLRGLFVPIKMFGFLLRHVILLVCGSLQITADHFLYGTCVCVPIFVQRGRPPCRSDDNHPPWISNFDCPTPLSPVEGLAVTGTGVVLDSINVSDVIDGERSRRC